MRRAAHAPAMLLAIFRSSRCQQHGKCSSRSVAAVPLARSSACAVRSAHERDEDNPRPAVTMRATGAARAAPPARLLLLLRLLGRAWRRLWPGLRLRRRARLIRLRRRELVRRRRRAHGATGGKGRAFARRNLAPRLRLPLTPPAWRATGGAPSRRPPPRGRRPGCGRAPGRTVRVTAGAAAAPTATTLATTATTLAAVTVAISVTATALALGRRGNCGARRVQALFALPLGQHIAVIDPDLHANDAEGRVRLGQAVVDVRAQRLPRHPPLDLLLSP